LNWRVTSGADNRRASSSLNSRMAMGGMSALVEAVLPSLRLDLLRVDGVLLAPVFVRDDLSDVLRTVRFLPLDMTTPSGPTPATRG
jgi:hypothetical protein